MRNFKTTEKYNALPFDLSSYHFELQKNCHDKKRLSKRWDWVNRLISCRIGIWIRRIPWEFLVSLLLKRNHKRLLFHYIELNNIESLNSLTCSTKPRCWNFRWTNILPKFKNLIQTHHTDFLKAYHSLLAVCWNTNIKFAARDVHFSN